MSEKEQIPKETLDDFVLLELKTRENSSKNGVQIIFAFAIARKMKGNDSRKRRLIIFLLQNFASSLLLQEIVLMII